MSIFLGEFTCKLDDKGRFKVPSELRRQIDRVVDGSVERFHIRKGFDGCLECYPGANWEEHLEKLTAKLNRNEPDARTLIRIYSRNGKDIFLDSAGRLLIPANLLEISGITNELVILGSGNCLELWNPDRLNAKTDLSDEEFNELNKRLLGGGNPSAN
jgi:MraZ protein